MSTTEKPKTNDRLMSIGIFVTAVWLALGLFYLAPRVDSLFTLPLNEMGDFLAGSFAPLAFFWLVLGFFQQGEELRTSNRALWIQGEELRNSVEQQRELVAATREGIAAEADRIVAERETAHEKARPLLKLEAGGWSGGSDYRNQTFNLLNYGEMCTGVVVRTNGNNVLDRNRMDPGDRASFQISLPSDLKFDAISISVTYIDTIKRSGASNFLITGDNKLLKIESAD